MSGSGSLLAHAVHAMHHRLLHRMQRQIEPELAGHRLQPLTVRKPFRLPIAVPNARLALLRARRSCPRPVQPLGVEKALPVQIAERQMRQPHIPNIPNAGRTPLPHALYPLTEKR